MAPLLRPRGFWDYAVFGLAMSGALLLMFWLESSNGVGWLDCAVALLAAALFVFGVIATRQGEKAIWLTRPTRVAYLLIFLGVFALVFGAIYVDAYLLHREDITSTRVRHDTIIAIVLLFGTLWSWRRRLFAKPGAPS